MSRLPPKTSINSLKYLSKFDPPSSRQNMVTLLLTSSCREQGLCECVGGDLAAGPSDPHCNVLPTARWGSAHTRTCTRAHQWPVNEACQHHSTSAHVPRRLQMWMTEVSVGQNITAANRGASATEGWGGFRWDTNSPTSQDPDTPDTVATEGTVVT